MIIDRKNTETAYIFIYSNVFKTDRLCIQYKNGWVSYCFVRCVDLVRFTNVMEKYQ